MQLEDSVMKDRKTYTQFKIQTFKNSKQSAGRELTAGHQLDQQTFANTVKWRTCDKPQHYISGIKTYLKGTKQALGSCRKRKNVSSSVSLAVTL